ncbi:MAG: NAD(P)-binding domain-containing protein, partial [Chloroflexi bacterium]|nr:NAD(P)-binding domain-containing protein [Chloroflexota bacterium]
MKPIRNTSIGFIGAGNVGTVLAVALRRLGYRVVAVNSRTLASAAALASRVPGCQALEAPQQVADLCSLVFLTVPDDAIAGLARSLHWRKDQVVVHCSGAEPLESLAPAQAAGALVGAFHPLQIFPERGADPSIFYGITFGIEAVSPLLEEMESLARELKGYPFRLSASDR